MHSKSNYTYDVNINSKFLSEHLNSTRERNRVRTLILFEILFDHGNTLCYFWFPHVFRSFICLD